MRGFAIVCLAAGAALGWIAASGGPDARLERLTTATRILTTPASAPEAPVVPAVRVASNRVFSPTPALAMTAVDVQPQSPRVDAPVSGARLGGAIGDDLPPPTIATTTLTASAPSVTPTRPPAARAPHEIARDLQRNLRRVGCYAGDIDGDWGPASRRAMREFVQGVNASLPVDEPDFILLTMVQGHTGPVCGVGCPGDQVRGDDGRCAATMARASAPRTAEPASSAAVAAGIAALASRQRDVAMSEAVKPRGEAPGSNRELTNRGGAERGPDRLAAAPIQVQALPAPLPGRMAIGGPLPPGEPGPAGSVTGSLRRSQPDGEHQAAPEPQRSRQAQRKQRPEPRLRRVVEAPVYRQPTRRRSFATAQSVQDFFFSPNRY